MFELTKEQAAIQKAAREFAEAEFTKDLILDIELNHTFPWELLHKSAELGFIGIDIPEQYGGQGYGLFEKTLVLEEFCRVGAGLGSTVGNPHFTCKLILFAGSEEQRRKYLPKVCSGELLPLSGAFTEPDRGSDLVTSPLGTTAVKDGSDYVINGTKTFITFADIAPLAVVLCQTDPNAKPVYRGQTNILIENLAKQKGVTVTPFIKNGLACGHNNTGFF